MDEIERLFFGGVNHFFDAAEEMKNSFFDAFGDLYGREYPLKEASPKPDEPGQLDLSGLAKDVFSSSQPLFFFFLVLFFFINMLHREIYYTFQNGMLVF